MSDTFSIRLIAAIIVGLMLIWHIYDDEKHTMSTEPCVYMYGCWLPICLLTLSVILVIMWEWDSAWNMILSMWFDTYLIISIYYCVIAFLIKPLRKIIRARTCALLWVVPNYLYLIQQNVTMRKTDAPLLIISMQEHLAEILFLIWITGFLTIMLWQMISHLRFRKWLLKDSAMVEDSHILEIWKEEKRHLFLQEKTIGLSVSANTTTPLSIGLLDKSICVVLPHASYTDEELRLVFRHELTHIFRRDSFTKLFLVLCSAMCWYNPFIWFAMKRSAEDIELSCDEKVLQEENRETRRQYADLILTQQETSVDLLPVFRQLPNRWLIGSRTSSIRKGRFVVGSLQGLCL